MRIYLRHQIKKRHEKRATKEGKEMKVIKSGTKRNSDMKLRASMYQGTELRLFVRKAHSFRCGMDSTII